jgi:DNA-binding NarL/FixJ family response regulator
MDILIVEDNRHMRRMLRQMVCEAFPAALVAEAADGAQVLALSAADAPRVVLMDIDLPDANGLALTAALKGNNASLSVIIVSNHGSSEYRKHAAAVGVDGYIQKDEVRAELLPLLTCLLEGPGRNPHFVSDASDRTP